MGALMYRWRWLCIVLGLLVGLPLFAIGEQYGRLVGIVYDQDGKECTGVTIKVTSPNLPGGSRETISTEDGAFTLNNLPPGKYKLTATKPGNGIVEKSIAIQVGKTASLYVSMELAFVPHEKFSKEAREEINYCSNLKPQTPVFWQEPGSIINHQGAVTKPPLKTVDDILAVELMQKTRASSTRRLKKLAGENSEVYPSDQTLQRMRLEAASRQETLLAVAFIQWGFHPYLIVSFIAFNDEIYAIETDITWNNVLYKSVTRLSPEQFEAFMEDTTEILDCAMTCEDPWFSSRASLVSWNAAGVPMQCGSGQLYSRANRFSDLLDKVTEKAITSDYPIDLNINEKLRMLGYRLRNK